MYRFALLNFKIFWRQCPIPSHSPDRTPSALRRFASPCLARGLRPLHRPSLCVVDILRYFRPCRAHENDEIGIRLGLGAYYFFFLHKSMSLRGLRNWQLSWDCWVELSSIKSDHIAIASGDVITTQLRSFSFFVSRVSLNKFRISTASWVELSHRAVWSREKLQPTSPMTLQVAIHGT